MQRSSGKKLKPASSVTWRKVKDEAVILDLETSVYYSVNGSGAFIWESLARGKERDKIEASFARFYDLSPERAAADVADFLKEISELGLLEKK